MGWFTKEEKWSRDTGRWEQTSGRKSRTPVYDAFKKQMKEEKRSARQAARNERRAKQRQIRTAFTEARHKERVKQARTRGRQSARPMKYSTVGNYNPIGGRYDTGLPYKRSTPKKATSTKYTIVGGKAYPIAGTKTKKKKRKKHSSSGFNFDIIDNWGW